MKKPLIAFLALSALAIIWLAAELTGDTSVLPDNDVPATAADWAALSRVLPGRFEPSRGTVAWYGALPGQTLNAGDAALESGKPVDETVRARVKFAAPEFLGRLSILLPLKRESPVRELKARLNLAPAQDLPITPWLAARGSFGLDADSRGSGFTFALNARGVALVLTLAEDGTPIGAATIESVSAAARLESGVLAIEQLTATSRGLRVSGEGQITIGTDYQSSTMAVNLNVTRSTLAQEPQLTEGFAAFAAPGNYQLTLVGSLAAPDVLVNGLPIDPDAIPSTLPSPDSARRPRQKTDPRTSAANPLSSEAQHTTTGGAPGRARGRAPLPWPEDSAQARRFEEIWTPFEKQFGQLADDGQTVRGLTRKALKRQVIDQVREEFGESVPQ